MEEADALQRKSTSAPDICLHTENIWTAESNRRACELGTEGKKIIDFYNLRGK